jgi:hypothetical protein
MATVAHQAAFWWAFNPPDFLQPGQTHEWASSWAHGSLIAGAFSVSAHPTGDDQFLAVENVRYERNAFFRQIHFIVRNVGSVAVEAYHVGIGTVTA